MRASGVRTVAFIRWHLGIAVVISLCSVVLARAQQEKYSSRPDVALLQLSHERLSNPAGVGVKSGPAGVGVKSGSTESAQQTAQAVEPVQQGSQVQKKSGDSSDLANRRTQETPVGAAAAPSESTMGVAASRPAGAAIAPAKQHRVRSIVIRVGLIVGAGVALGTVLALSRGTPSRPQ
jgi:hypothetical protein